MSHDWTKCIQWVVSLPFSMSQALTSTNAKTQDNLYHISEGNLLKPDKNKWQIDPYEKTEDMKICILYMYILYISGI